MSETPQPLRAGALCLVVCFAWLGLLLPALAQTASELTPSALRGIWYPKSDLGTRQCARVRRDGVGELHAGALQVTHTQLIDWKGAGQHTMVFVTESRPRKRQVWRVQGLLDEYPYDAPKALQTYVFELKKNELRWYKRSFDVVAERVDTFIYERCL